MLIVLLAGSHSSRYLGYLRLKCLLEARSSKVSGASLSNNSSNDMVEYVELKLHELYMANVR